MKKILLSILFLMLARSETGWCRVEGYKLGPRDVLTISIYAGGQEQETIDVTLSELGKINVPFIGTITAKGLTLTELEQAILVPLERDYFVSPQVNIQIKGYHSISFFISGAVKSAGKYEMTSDTNFLELLAKAGGVLSERGNVAYVLRENDRQASQNRETLKVDLTGLLDEGDMSHNIRLISGDIIYIPLSNKLNQAGSKIYVEGEIKTPGVYDFQPGMTALAACIMAGGFGKYAAISRAKIIRLVNGEQDIINIDLKKVSEGKAPDFPIKPGDRIHIPETWL